MTSLQAKERPTLTSMPPLAEEDILTTEQWGIFAAIADTVIPAFTPTASNRLLNHPLRREIYQTAVDRIRMFNGDNADDELLTQYMGECATALPEFRKSVLRFFGCYIDSTARSRLTKALSALSTWAGALFLTGYATPLDCLPIQSREKILQSWQTSRLPLLRTLHKSLTSIIKVYWLRTSPALGPLIGYPRAPVRASPPGIAFPFEFLQIPSSTSQEPEIIETDAVIVGSGCGGAVAAKALSEAGLKVIVVDKSYYWPPDQLPLSEGDAALHLFANGGATFSDDTITTIISGSTWGGGGSINWSASLQTQGYVRREWSQDHGLHYFASSQFQTDLDAVCERVGVSTEGIHHNKTNETLLEGARKLGWSAKVVPQNSGGRTHHCGGYCTLGCGASCKQGPAQTNLPDAAKAGATFIEGFDVDRVLFEDPIGGVRTATGIKGTWSSRDSHGSVVGKDRTRREVILKARRVILAAGALSTPLLLQRSELRNRHIGRHLQLHPVSMVGATWPEDVKPWEGPILSAVVNEFENLDGKGFGTKLEATAMLPSWFLPFFSWQSGLQWKEFAAKMKRMTGYISLARARYSEGKVYADPTDGRCRVQYAVDAYDKEHILEGVARLAELIYIEGAQEIFTAVPGLEPFQRPSAEPSRNVKVTGIAKPSSNDIEFQTWLAKLRKIGLPSPDASFAAAHQMGSCRMGTNAKESAVDPKGRVWNTHGLYVCDSSVFPSASGVNPMITVMAISRMIAREIVEEEKMSVRPKL